MIQMSDCAWPGGSAAFQCHCSQRAELTSEPFSSAKQLEHFGLDGRRIGRILRTEILPEPRGLGVERIHRDQEFELAQTLSNLAPIGERLQRIEALADISSHLAVHHHLESLDDVVKRNVEFRQPVVGPVIVRARGVAKEGLLEADEELGGILIIADRARTKRLETPRLHVLLVRLLVVERQIHVSRHLVRQQSDIGQPLDVRVAAQGIHAAAGHADVAEQQLDHRHGADVLGTDRMLGPAQREQRRHRLVRRRRGGDQFTDLQVLVLRRAADARHHFGRVASDMLAQKIDHATRILPGVVYFGKTLVIEFVIPARLVIASGFLVIAAEQAVLKTELFLHEQTGIGVGPHVVVLDRILFQQIADQAAEERDIGSGPYRRVHVGDRRGSRETRIDHHQLGGVLDLGLDHPFEAARMRFGGIAAHHDDDIGILDVAPGVGHCTATE
jgi:hypothetical protein